MATRKRHNPEQVVRKLMAADRLLGEGKDVAAVCRELGVSEATYHRWRNQFGGLIAVKTGMAGGRRDGVRMVPGGLGRARIFLVLGVRSKD